MNVYNKRKTMHEKGGSDMRAIGIDIGTTSISAIVLDIEKRTILHKETLPNAACLAGEAWEDLQDANALYAMVCDLLEAWERDYAPVFCIGLTGQMHGIVYVDACGEAVTPLYTWRDGRGSLANEAGLSFADALAGAGGYPLSTGYGMVTHAYNQAKGEIPAGARRFCSIADFVAMKLACRATAICGPSMAQSFGLFDVATRAFDLRAAARCGIDMSFFPEIITARCAIGRRPNGALVSVAIGDNQASFLGSVREHARSVLVNIGTGGQITMLGQSAPQNGVLETRPFIGEENLLVGSALCGGAAYARLEQFFRAVCKLDGGGDKPLYAAMAELAEQPLRESLRISTCLMGTRDKPGMRGCIQNMGWDTFTPAHFVQGFMQGIVDELFAYYSSVSAGFCVPKACLVGAGNGLRKNAAMQRVLAKTFGMPLLLPQGGEEAALGSALFALYNADPQIRLEELRAFIQYLPNIIDE